MHPVHQIMVVRARLVGQSPAAERTPPVLRQIQNDPLLEMALGVLHARLSQLLTVLLPRWIKGIEVPLYLCGIANSCTASEYNSSIILLPSSTIHGIPKHPMPTIDCVKVFLLHPLDRLTRMASFGPSPESLENQKLHAAERPLGRNVVVILRPTTQHRVS